MTQETARAATISKQRLNTGSPRIFYGTSLARPPIMLQSLSAKVPKEISTPLFSGPSDPDIIIETSTPSDKTFTIPATPKPKEDNLTITVTSKEKVVQVQKKEDPFKNFVEVEAPSYIFLTEEQYYAKDTISGKYTILNRETLRTKITEPISTPTVVTAIVASAAKTASKSRKPFGTLPKDEWEPSRTTIEKLQKEASVLLHKYGAASAPYIQKKKDLDWTIRARDKL
ncbi:MAG: hypothetical protein GY861_27815 [bacterium]|nr:hypothetical protein [bacterium]